MWCCPSLCFKVFVFLSFWRHTIRPCQIPCRSLAQHFVPYKNEMYVWECLPMHSMWFTIFRLVYSCYCFPFSYYFLCRSRYLSILTHLQMHLHSCRVWIPCVNLFFCHFFFISFSLKMQVDFMFVCVSLYFYTALRSFPFSFVLLIRI